MHFGQVVAQRHFALAAQCLHQRVGAHVGVAIAVAANPLAHAQKAVYLLHAQIAFQVGVNARNFTQKGRLVVAQGVFDLVGHGQLAVAQQARLPQLGHAGAQLASLAARARGVRASLALL